MFNTLSIMMSSCDCYKMRSKGRKVWEVHTDIQGFHKRSGSGHGYYSPLDGRTFKT